MSHCCSLSCVTALSSLRSPAKYANEDTYVGEYRSGKRHGRGVYTFANGAKYDGEYVDGLKEGQGSFLTLDGGKYSGSWKADKRSGFGTYVYKSGDSYTGEWANDRKHGKGTYTYASNGSSITGVWSNGQIMHGSWFLADGSKFTGAWHKNQPNGFGMHRFTNGNQIVGNYSIDKKEGYKWSTVAPVLSPPNAEGKVVTPDPLKVAARFIEKCILKLDHFEGIYRLKKEVEGCPNLRKIPEVSVFALGQPTISGLKAFVEWAGEQHSTDKFVWVNLRAEPIVYVNNQSFIPRSKHALNAPMSLRGLAAATGAAASSSAAAAAAEGPEPLLTPDQLSTIESSLVSKLVLDVSHRGNLHVFLKDTFAEQVADRKNLEMSEEVRPETDEDSGAESYANAIQTPSKVFLDLAENDGVDIEYKRMPWASGGLFPSPSDIDQIVQLVKNNDSSTGIVFNDQMGRGRATLGSVIVTLMRRTADALASADDREASALGRTDHENLEIPEYDEADPNYKLGQYAIIMRLVREGLAPASSAAAAGAGDQIKAEVDDAVDRCKAMQSLREIIFFAKEMHDNEAASVESTDTPAVQDASGARRAFWRDSAQNYLQRYAMLLVFQAYVKANIESEYENQSFSQFCKEKQEVIDTIIGSKTQGPLKDFRWQ